MSHAQWGVVAVAGALVILLFFGFDTKSDKQNEIIKSNELAGTKIEISKVIEAAKESLNAQDLKRIQFLELTLEASELGNEQRSEALKQLSSEWFRLRRPLIAGHYAEAVAEYEQNGNAWGIAGTTYLSGIKSKDVLVKNGSFAGAIRSLENAISLDPDTIRHRVNLALAYTESPPKNNPMKGIQILLSLNERYPENVVVLNTLARLAIRTGQYGKAVERLEKALTIDSKNITANCLLADAYEQSRDARAPEQRNKCELLTTKE